MNMYLEARGNNNTLVAQELSAGTLPKRRSQYGAEAGEKPLPVLPESEKSPPDIQKTLSNLEQINLAFNKKFKFKVDHQEHEVTIKVIDPETDKVIKELPPKELERLRDYIREAVGVLFDAQI